jgi:hypothetical protein
MLKILRFGDTDAAEHTLNGGIVSGKQMSGKLLGLHGLTLIFGTPAGTVTFNDPTGEGLSVGDIKDQIVAVHATLTVQFYEGSLRIRDTDVSSAVVLDKDGTANAYFGFSKAKDISGTVYNPPDGAAPRLIDFSSSPRMDGFVAVVEVT